MDINQLTLLTDLYELTMMQGYFKSKNDETVIFDVFYRENPSGGSYAIACGLEQLIDYIKNLSFSYEDLITSEDSKFLTKIFWNTWQDTISPAIFTQSRKELSYSPMEPLVKVQAPMMEAQLIETAILNIINHQSLIATKASRVVYAAGGSGVMEFGLRRAQGPDAGTYGARAAVIGGCDGTSNVLAGKLFGVPVLGTHAHSWIMSFDDEYTAFRTYADLYPDACTLLVDTYDTLRSGVPNAIRVFQELRDSGRTPARYGIRLDSGDLAYLSKKARAMLDDAGFPDAVISASGDLDEHLIASLRHQGAPITSWGVGTKLITSADCPAFGGVYKLAASKHKNESTFTAKIKISENPAKITNPGDKIIFRLYDSKNGKIRGDLICLSNESYDPSCDLTIFDPLATWKKSTLQGGTYQIRELLVPVFLKGKCVYESPSVMDIRSYCQKELDTLWDESRRRLNPQEVYVDLSLPLYQLKHRLLDQKHENKKGETQ